MIFQLSYLFLSSALYNIEKLFLKKNFKKVVILTFYIVSFLFLIFTFLINYDISNNDLCSGNIHEQLQIHNGEIKVTFKSISMFPELSKISCFGKLSNTVLDNGELNIEVLTSRLLLEYINIFYGALFGLASILVNNRNKYIGLAILYLLSDYMLNMFYFQLDTNYSFLLLKIIFLIMFFQFFVQKKEFSRNFEFLSILLILLAYIKPLNFNLHPDDLYYLGYAIQGLDQNSAFFGNEQLYLYSLLLKNLYSLFGIYSVMIIKTVLSCWLAINTILFSNYFNIQQRLRIVLSIFIISFQSFAGGDQLWGSFVPKNICYLFILSGIYTLIKKRIILSALFFALSAYFQMAAFIIWLPFIGILYLFNVPLKEIILSSLLVVSLAFPLIYSLFTQNFNSSITKAERGESLKFIITEYLPGHLYPFIFENQEFLKVNPNWTSGLRNILIFLVVVLFISIFNKSEHMSIIRLLQYCSFLIVLPVIFNFFFPINTYMLLHPYKIISLSSLLLSLYFVLLLNSNYFKENISTYLIIMSLFSFSPFIYELADSNYNYRPTFSTSQKFKNELLDINPNILILPLYEQNTVQDKLLDIEIYTGINTFVAYKYFPTTIKDTRVWKERIKMVSSFYKGDCNALRQIDEFYFIDYVENDCGIIVSEVGQYKIFKIDY
jgi:hypothetical protein